LQQKKSEYPCLGRVKTYVLELEQIKRDEIEVRWLGDELSASHHVCVGSMLSKSLEVGAEQ
jgi:hypothetical protein